MPPLRDHQDEDRSLINVSSLPPFYSDRGHGGQKRGGVNGCGGTVKLCRSNTRWHFTVSTNTTSLAYFTFAGQPSRSTALPLSLGCAPVKKPVPDKSTGAHLHFVKQEHRNTPPRIRWQCHYHEGRHSHVQKRRQKKKKKTKRLRWRQAIKTVKCNEILQALVTMLSPLSNSLTSLPSFLPFFFHLFSLWSYDRLPQGLLGSIATHFSWIRIFLFAKSNLSTICMLITKGLFSILDHVLFARLASPLSL